MKKIAYTLFFLIIFGIIIFSFLGGNQQKFSKKEYKNLSEKEQYCLFKGGELGKNNSVKTCILDGIEKELEVFFIDSLRKEE